jgi:shikimate dehydrogenase
MHNAALRHAKLPLAYEALDVEPAALRSVVRRLVARRTCGNVTIPHKAAMVGHCTRLTPIAERVGGVNAFRVVDEDLLEGTNTDVGGFDALARDVGGVHANARVALLGAGSAAAAVLAALERWPNASVTLYNRDAARARALASRFKVVAQVAPAASAACEQATLVINATPLGLGLRDEFPVEIDALPEGSAVLDLAYRPGETRWVRAARARHHAAADGLSMLIEQGALAFEWWFDLAAPREIMRDAVTQEARRRLET